MKTRLTFWCKKRLMQFCGFLFSFILNGSYTLWYIVTSLMVIATSMKDNSYISFSFSFSRNFLVFLIQATILFVWFFFKKLQNNDTRHCSMHY